MRTVNIDFSNENLQQIGTIDISVDRKRENFFQHQLPRRAQSFGPLIVETPDLPQDLKLKPKRPLLLVSHDGDTESTIEKLLIDGYGRELPILLDPNAVRDWEGSDELVTIKYQVLFHDRDSLIAIENGEVALQIRRPQARLAWCINLPEAEVHHDATESEKLIGHLVLKNQAQLKASHPIEAEVHFIPPNRIGGKPVGRNAFKLDFKKQLSSVGRFKPAGDLTTKVSISANTECEIPITMSWGEIENPERGRAIFSFEIKIFSGDGQSIEPIEGSSKRELLLLPDRRHANPLVVFEAIHSGAQVNDAKIMGRIHSSEEEASKNPIQARCNPLQLPPSGKGEGRSFNILRIELGNEGVTGPGWVCCSEINTILYQKPEGQIIYQEGKGFDDLLYVHRRGSQTTIERSLPLEMPSLPGRPMTELILRMRMGVVKSVPRSGASMWVMLSLVGEYSTNGGRPRPFCCSILLYLELTQSFGDCWMSLDFGTSGIVAIVGESEDVPSPLPIGDADSRILASSLFVESGHPLEERRFVLLQTAPNIVEQLWRSRIPYLKSIIGSPRVELIDRNFFYLDEDGERVQNGPPTQHTLDATFVRVLQDHLHEKIKDYDIQVEDLKQVVLTTPNGFFDKHRDALRQAICVAFGRTEEELHAIFVSESDAVAFYYYQYWRRFNYHRMDKERFQPNTSESRTALHTQEYILIYDIGAGTLDITYVCVTRKILDGALKDEMEILARVGRSSAGNNLDTLIAEAFTAKQEEGGIGRRADVLPSSIEDTATHFNARLKLKSYAEKLKLAYAKAQDEIVMPFLSPRESLIFDQNPDQPVTIADIKENEGIKRFLWDITVGSLTELFELVPDTTHDGGKIRNSEGRAPIDTVIATGRCVQFPGIIEHLKLSVDGLASDPERVYFVDLENAQANLKTIVAEGAYLFARTNVNGDLIQIKPQRPDAWYGIIYQEPQSDKRIFTPIIGPEDRFEQGASPPSVTRRKEVNLRRTQTILLVKSFAREPLDEIAGKQFLKYSSKVMAKFPVRALGIPLRTINAVEIELTFNQAGDIEATFGGLNIENIDVLSASPGLDSTDPAYLQGIWPFFQGRTRGV